VLLNEVRGWAKGTLPTYQDRKEFFESIVNGQPDPIALLRGQDGDGEGDSGDEQASGGGEDAVRELIARAQEQAERAPQVTSA
jgi:precorrin-2 dehydrogenase / sirohydrochlorin ferrochelatase